MDQFRSQHRPVGATSHHRSPDEDHPTSDPAGQHHVEVHHRVDGQHRLDGHRLGGQDRLDGQHRADGRADGQRLDGVGGLDEEALRRLVVTQPVIEQAKGMVMACYGVDADGAWSLLTRLSSTRHVKVRDLCAGLVAAAARPAGEPYGSLHTYLQDERPA